MRESAIGLLIGLAAAALLYWFSLLPWGWAAALAVAGAMGWRLGAYVAEQRRMAAHDELTGVANRRPFERALQREFARAARYGRPLSLLFLELDDFGEINKQHGHLAGDEALKSVAGQLRDGVRTSDVLCRWGGDEFALLLPETSPDLAMALAERLRFDVQGSQIQDGDRLIRVTVSTGVSGIPGRAKRPADLLRMAIEAQRLAKVQKNSVRIVS